MQLKKELKVSYRDVQVKSVTIFVVNIENIGTLPISRGDYDRELAIAFSDRAQIMAKSVLNASPRSLEPSLLTDGINIRRVLIEKLLLNPGDNSTISMSVADHEGDPSFDVRLVGGKLIQNTYQSFAKMNRLLNISTVIVVVLCLAELLTFYLGKHQSTVSAMRSTAVMLSLLMYFREYRKNHRRLMEVLSLENRDRS